MGLEKFVIDTNVIMIDPYCVNKLGGKIYIPTTVLEELDKHKNDNGELGRNIREFARIVDKNPPKNLEFFDTKNIFGSEVKTNDDIIAQVAYTKSATLVTNDILMSIKAKSRGIKTQRYEPVNIIFDSAYTGLLDSRGENINPNEIVNLAPNQYHLSDKGLFFKSENKREKRLGKDKEVWGIMHRNVEQKCAIHALLNDDIKLVTISGKAGTGKTLLAIACGLEKVIGENEYRRLLVSRPVVPMGNDIGYLPGNIDEKLGPWMQPIFDNIDYLFNINKEKKSFDAYEDLASEGLLKIEALTYIRGRSIPDQYMIIDEAQNLSKHEVKTIISRAGEGTKIIMTGDPDQIDNPRLDSINNGLTYVIEKFRDQKIAAHITLSKGERSELADIASDIL